MLIGEITKATKLSKDGIRHYESLGLIHSTPVNAGSRVYRNYDETTYKRLEFIKTAKHLGFGLREIGPFLDKLMNENLKSDEKKKILSEKLLQIEQKIAQLHKLHDQITDIINDKGAC